MSFFLKFEDDSASLHIATPLRVLTWRSLIIVLLGAGRLPQLPAFFWPTFSRPLTLCRPFPSMF